VSDPLSEYELALTAYGLKRRLWAERYLGFLKPLHQLEWETMRDFFKETIKHQLRSHDTLPRHIGGTLDDSHNVYAAGVLRKRMCFVSPTIRTKDVVFNPERIWVDEGAGTCRIDVLNIPILANQWSGFEENQPSWRTARLSGEWLKSLGFRLETMTLRSWIPAITTSGGLDFNPSDETLAFAGARDPDAGGLESIPALIREARETLSDTMSPPEYGCLYPPLDQSLLRPADQMRLCAWSLTSNNRHIFSRLNMGNATDELHDTCLDEVLREKVIDERLETPFPQGYCCGAENRASETLFLSGATLPISAAPDRDHARLGLSLLCMRFEEAGVVKTREFGFNTFATRHSSKEFQEFEAIIARHVREDKPAVWCGEAEAQSGVSGEIKAMLPHRQFDMISVCDHLAYEHPDLYITRHEPEGLECMFGPTGAARPETGFDAPEVNETGLAVVMALTGATGSEVKEFKDRARHRALYEIDAVVQASHAIQARRQMHHQLVGNAFFSIENSKLKLVHCAAIDRALEAAKTESDANMIAGKAGKALPTFRAQPLSATVQQELAL
jgi:hypothetical protein